MTDEQLAFDIEGMLHEAAVEAAPEWRGAPLHFTTAFYSPSALDDAVAHWQFLHLLDGSRRDSRMWHRAVAVPGGVEIGEHGFDLFTADLRCDPWKHPATHGGCACVGDLTYMAICEPHRWHGIANDENSAVEGWHDHSFPGWRDLPVVPARLRDSQEIGLSKAARKWVDQHYPESMRVVGAPVITERSGIGTRHVPGRSPWGGYDVSSTAVRARSERDRRQPRDRCVEPVAPAPAAGLVIGD